MYKLAVWTEIFQMSPSISQSDLNGVHQVYSGQWTSKVNRIAKLQYIVDAMILILKLLLNGMQAICGN